MPVLAVEGADIYYEVHGKGPPMLLIAGTACDGAFWKPHQVPEFSLDHTVIIFDQRGMGQTIIRDDDYSTGRLAADAAQLSRRSILGLRSWSATPWAAGSRSLSRWIIPRLSRRWFWPPRAPVMKSRGWGFRRGSASGSSRKAMSATSVSTTSTSASASPRRGQPGKGGTMYRRANDSAAFDRVYIAHVNSRQWHDTRARLKDLRVPSSSLSVTMKFMAFPIRRRRFSRGSREIHSGR